MSISTPTVLDALTVGNATIDAFLSLHNAELHCRLDKTSCELCVRYGEKIPLDGCEFHVGGNATNVAVGLTRGGYQVGLMAEIGEDEFAAKISNTLLQEKINTMHVQKKGQSSFAIGLQFQDERTLFVQHQQREHNFSFEGITTKLVYLTSIGNAWEDAYKKTLDYVTKTQCMLAFNPGTLQIQKGVEQIRDVLNKAEILFINKEETETLFDISGKTIPELLCMLRRDTLALIIMTHGRDGGYALTPQGTLYHMPTISGPVVEKTGAGDAFASGFLVSYLQDADVKKALKYATVNAVAVIGKVGSQAGLLRKAEFEEAVTQVPEADII